MKKLKILFILIFVMALSIGLAAVILPYHTYYLALSEGIQNNYIDLPRYPDLYYSGKRVSAIIENDEASLNHDHWRRFPFENYTVPLPYQNPLFVFVPDFKFIDGKERKGFSLISNQGKFYIHFMIGGVYKFKVDYQTDWIFRLPYFSKYIRNKKHEQIWTDIFTKEIKFPEQGKLGLIEYLSLVSKMDLHQMVYNVFVLKSRKNFLPENVISFAQFPDSNLAIVELEPRFSGTKLEKIFLYRDGELFTYYLETSLNQEISKYLRWNFIKNVEYTENPPEKAIGIYALFRKLEFKQKTNQEGLIHLFTAWTLDPTKKDFLKEMVQYLERGPSTNLVYLKPLYKYSLKHYDTTFSLRELNKLETPEQRRLRLKEEAAKKLDRNTDINPESRYQNQDDKAAALLQKAKNKRRKKEESMGKTKVDEEEGVIEIN